MTVAVYNAAGERVRVLFNGAANVGPGDLRLDSSSLDLGGARLGMTVPGVLANGLSTLAWDGSNEGGQSVSAGTYYVKMQIVDPFGKISSTIASLAVLDTRPVQYLAVFNAAGERVRAIPLPAGMGTGGFDLGSDTLLTGGQAAAAVLKVDLRLGQGRVFASQWDGKNDAGAFVDTGVYTIALISRQGSEGTRVMAKSVQVLRAPEDDPAASAHPMQDPLPAGQNELRLAYTPRAGRQAWASLYDLAGSRVSQGTDLGSVGIVSIPCGHLSAGIYLARLEISDAQRMSGKKTLKIAVLR